MPDYSAPIKTRKGATLRPRESSAPDADAICKRAAALLQKRTNVDSLQQELADYIIPRKAVITDKPGTEGEELTERVWSSTPIRANELLAARMQSALTSPSTRWFSLRTRDEAQNDTSSVKDWLNDSENRIYLSLRQSNFNQEIAEVFLDLGALGIGAMLIEEHPKQRPGFNGFLFVSLAPGTYAIAEAPSGEVNTLYRFHKMTVSQCAQEFGLDALPESWRDLFTNAPDTDKDLIHAIEPRQVGNPKRRDSLHMPWASVWLTKDDKTILRESGYQEFPAIVPRWAKTSGEIYGRGPGHTALPDIRTLNRLKDLSLRALEKAVDPPGFVSSDSNVAELDLRAGSQNVVDGDPRTAWVPLEAGTKFDVKQMEVQQLENDIRNTFYWDQLQLTTDRDMTLGEVQRRLELMQQFLSPVLARLEAEGLAPLINRCFGLMWRAGALLPPPDELRGAELDIEYEGPLARSQKTTRLAGYEEFERLTAPLLARNPTVAQNLDDDYAYRDLADVAGLPSQYLRDESDRDQARQAQQQQQAMENQLARANSVTESLGKMAPFIDKVKGVPGGPDALANLGSMAASANGVGPQPPQEEAA